jgi:hypothetical protein
MALHYRLIRPRDSNSRPALSDKQYDRFGFGVVGLGVKVDILSCIVQHTLASGILVHTFV